MIKKIYSKHAPETLGPYSQAMTAGGLIFCSGQIGADPKTGELVVGLDHQTSQALKNLELVLKSAGSDLDFVVKTTVYITNIANFAIINSTYSEFFKIHKPSRTTVEVSALPKGALIEIDAIAVRKA